MLKRQCHNLSKAGKLQYTTAYYKDGGLESETVKNSGIKF